MRIFSRWSETTGVCHTCLRAFPSLALVLAALLVFVSHGGSLTASAQTNRAAMTVVRRAAGIELPWTQLNWWTTLCWDRVDRRSSREPSSGLPAGALYRSHTGSRVVALSQLLDGDCNGAINTLELIAGAGTPNSFRRDSLLAHLYVMTAAWDRLRDMLPSAGLEATPWTVRRFWANVSYRIGASPALSPVASSIWVQSADRLSGSFPLEGSIDLADYLMTTSRPAEAFDELRRAMVLMTTPDMLALYPKYVVFRQAALAEDARQHPDDPEAQRLYDKYAAASTLDPASRLVVLSTAPAPEYQFHYDVSPNWKLIGMDLDQDDLRLGPLIYVTFYWCRRRDSVCVQHIAMSGIYHNLIGNSSFEWDPRVSNVRPFGFLGGYYGESYPFPYEIMAEGNRQAFCLTSDFGYESAGVATMWRELAGDGSQRLVQGGSFRTTESGTAYIGWRWRSDIDQGFNHIITSERAEHWTARAGVVELPAQATQVVFHLLRYRSKGTACFDDMFVFYMPAPPEDSIGATS